VAEAELGRGGEIARKLGPESGKAEIAPVGWTLLRARRRLRPWAGLCFGRGGDFAPEGRSPLLVVLDVPTGDGRWRACTVTET
jgi:hypothetical protein